MFRVHEMAGYARLGEGSLAGLRGYARASRLRRKRGPALQRGGLCCGQLHFMTLAYFSLVEEFLSSQKFSLFAQESAGLLAFGRLYCGQLYLANEDPIQIYTVLICKLCAGH